MEVYQEASAVDQAVALVEQVRAYCMREAAKQEEAAGIGPFAGFVLLREAHWDSQKLAEDLRVSCRTIQISRWWPKSTG